MPCAVHPPCPEQQEKEAWAWAWSWSWSNSCCTVDQSWARSLAQNFTFCASNLPLTIDLPTYLLRVDYMYPSYLVASTDLPPVYPAKSIAIIVSF